MDDFFARVEGRARPWPAGRRDLHWLIIPGQNFARERLYEPYRALAGHPGLCPVAPEWMHITVLHAGPEDTASPAEVEQIVAEVTRRTADMAPFDLVLSRPDIGTVAIESKGFPGAPHRELWELTWQAQHAVVGDRWPRIPAVSYPHLSHAYAGSEAHRADRTTLKVVLSDLPGGPVTVPVTTLTLVSQWHDRREIRWEVLAEVPLRGARWGGVRLNKEQWAILRLYAALGPSPADTYHQDRPDGITAEAWDEANNTMLRAVITLHARGLLETVDHTPGDTEILQVSEQGRAVLAAGPPTEEH